MSLAIDIGRVESVLLPDGEWCGVLRGSFVIDRYEFIAGGLGNGDDKYHDAEADGFAFIAADGMTIAGPLSSVVAVSYWDES